MTKLFFILSSFLSFSLFGANVCSSNQKASSSNSSSTSSSLDLQSAMSQEELKQTGVNKLNPKQVQALSSWIENYQTQSDQAKPNQVSMVLNEGQYVQLGSGKIWTINPNAWIYTYYWQKGDPIKVSKSNDQLFPVTLTNENSGQSVNAQMATGNIQQAFSKHQTISKIENDGQFIQLSDGSLWQVEPSARYMVQGWSANQPVYIVKVKNNTGAPYQLYNGETTRSVFVTQVKAAPQKKSKTQKSNQNASNANAPSVQNQNTHSKPQS